MIKKELINQSIDYMLTHIDEKFTVWDVANHFHYSSTTSVGHSNPLQAKVYTLLSSI